MVVIRSLHNQVIRWIVVAKYCHGVDEIEERQFKAIKHQAMNLLHKNNVSGAIGVIFKRVGIIARSRLPTAWEVYVKAPTKETQ